MRILPFGIVPIGPGRRRVERLVGIKLIDKQEETLVMSGVVLQPLRRRVHGARPWKIQLLAKPGTAVVVVAMRRSGGRQCGCAHPGRVGAGFPRIAFVAAHIFPGAKVSVVVLPTSFKKVRMIAHQHRRHPLFAQGHRDGLFP